MAISVPAVSAVIPCYNNRGCILTAVESALRQERHVVEVIVVDDGSRDATPDTVEAAFAEDARVRLIRCRTNRGPSAARNIALRAATGTWIGVLDADDAWLPGRIARLLEHAEGADYIADNILAYDAVAGVRTGPIYDQMGDRWLHLVDLLRPAAPDTHDLGYLKPLFRRDFVVRHGLTYREHVRVGEDLLFSLDFLVAGGRARYVDEALYLYATPVGRLSGRASPHSRSAADTGPLRSTLASLRQDLGGRISGEEDAAFTDRLIDLRRQAPIAAFHRARARSQFGRMIWLLAREPAVRRRALDWLARERVVDVLRRLRSSRGQARGLWSHILGPTGVLLLGATLAPGLDCALARQASTPEPMNMTAAGGPTR